MMRTLLYRLGLPIVAALMIWGWQGTPTDASDKTFPAFLKQMPVVVEVQTGRPKPHEFAGIVGALFVDLDQNAIYVAEFSSAVPPPHTVALFVRRLALTNVRSGTDHMDFDCIDEYGIEWRGKIHAVDGAPYLTVDIVQRGSPRRIVNLGPLGRQFIQRKGLAHVFLGMGG